MIEKLEPLEVYSKIDVVSLSALAGKIDELVDAVNTIQKEREAERFEIQEWIGILEAVRKSVNIHEKPIDELQMKVEPEKCKAPINNTQDHMIGCTTLDIPKSYKNDQLTLATLDYSKKLEKENSELKDELERITDILYESKYALEEMLNPSCISHEQQIAQEALDKVNAEIKAQIHTNLNSRNGIKGVKK